MAEPVFDTAVVILGMHRSGTSAVAGVLGLAGLATPETLIPTAEANERGFWESEPVKSLNDQVLKRLDLTWYGLEPINDSSLQERRFQSDRRQAEKILKAEFPAGKSFVLKEPRLCRLVPFWDSILEGLARKVVYTFTLRNPVEVARSLARRNDMDPDVGMLLWARYSLDAECHTRGKARAFISYSAIIQNWQPALQKLNDKLGLQLNLTGPKAEAIDDYISADLQHQSEKDEEASARIPLVGEAYRIFRGWASGQAESEQDYRTLDEARRQLDELGPISDAFERARLDRKRLSNARSQVEKATADLDHTKRSLEQLDHVRGSLDELRGSFNTQTKTIDDLRLEVKSHRAAQARLEATAVALTQALEEKRELEASLAAVAASGAAAAAKVEIYQAELQRAAAEAENKDLAARELEASLAAALASAAAAAAKVQTFEGELQKAAAEAAAAAVDKERAAEAAKAENEALEAELKRVKHKYRAAQFDLEREHRAHGLTKMRLSETEAEVAGYRRSLPWRAYMSVVSAFRRMAGAGGKLSGNGRKRRAQQLELIRNSPLFDREWYLRAYPDVAGAGMDAAAHFYANGWREGRDPGPEFATSAYLKANFDVARAGINPLLHYIEFGASEGRGIVVRRPRAALPEINYDFGPPAPVFRGHIDEDQPVTWLRSYRLSKTRQGLVSVSDCMVGYAEAPEQRLGIEAGFARLRRLSGFGEGPSKPERAVDDPTAQMIDAWYVSEGQLRTRWNDDELPLVIRGYQHDPLREGCLTLVAEGLVASPLDFVDVNLNDPYSPILFAICEPGGTLRGTRLLAFPSLCRGGVHYPELLASSPAGASPDPIQCGLELAARMEALGAGARGAGRRLVRTIAVDLSGADGTSPLFQPAFRAWLDRVAGVSVEAVEGIQSPAADMLRAQLKAPAKPARSGGKLVLAADMIPTIRALSHTANATKAKAGSSFLPLLIAGAEPSQPAMFVSVPATSAAALELSASGFAVPWPRLTGVAAEEIGAGAIRLPGTRNLTDAELLVPAMATALPFEGTNTDPITWVITPSHWQPAQLIEALQALALQADESGHVVAFVGDVDPSVRIAADEFFEGRVRVFRDMKDAVKALDTPLAGYLGPSVILHDRRSAMVFSSLLADSAVTSAACVLVATEKRGKTYHVSVADGGTIPNHVRGQRPQADQCADVQKLWRASYPVRQPPRDLWVVRTSSLQDWAARKVTPEKMQGTHICTSLITASYLGGRSSETPTLTLPRASDDRAIKTKALFG
jgi:hypothetical protein